MGERWQASGDDWDQHWDDFRASAERGPGPRYRRRLILRQLGIGAAGESVRLLEIGSGAGEFAAEFCGRYPHAEYLGLELSRRAVDLASRRVPRARFLQGDLSQRARSEEAPDFRATHAVCSEVIEHLDEPRTLLANAALYMAAGCQLVVTVPGGPMNEFYRHIGHRRHYSARQLSELLEAAGFRIERSYDAGFPFFNLFRLLLTWRGQELIDSASGPPSAILRLGMSWFDLLFRLNLMRWGWQTIASAEYRGAVPPLTAPCARRT